MGNVQSIENRKARHLYTITDTVEAGVELLGSEVKSLRAGRANIKDAYVRIMGGQAYLVGAHISPYTNAGTYGHDDPLRSRRLLLHRKQIDQLEAESKQGGMTLVPLKVYFKQGWAKVLVGVGKGKKKHDKREDLKKQEQKREMERHAKGKVKI